MDSIGGMLNHIGKMPKRHYKKEFCLLMETIGISVMVSMVFLSRNGICFVGVSCSNLHGCLTVAALRNI